MNQKIALITGGSRGLGRDGALHLAARGVDSIVTYRSSQTEAEAVVQEIEAQGRRAIALRLDLAKSGAVEGFARELKGVLQTKFERPDFDFLLNNAGHGAHATFAETTEEQFDELMNVHLKGVFFLTQHLLPLIRDGGRIVNVSSGLVRFSLPGYAAYATMKGAVETLTRYMAKELGSRGISVNTLAPGAIATDFGGGAVRDNQELQTYLSSVTALGRVGQPEDIGRVIATLFSEDTNWINGQRIEASGGMFL